MIRERRDIREELQDARERYHALREKAAEQYRRGLGRAREAGQSFESYVRERPVRSIGISLGVALAAGLLIGALIRR